MSLRRNVSFPLMALLFPSLFVTVDLQAGMVGARREKPSAVVAETAEGLHRPVIMMGHGRNASLDDSGLSQKLYHI